MSHSATTYLHTKYIFRQLIFIKKETIKPLSSNHTYLTFVTHIEAFKLFSKLFLHQVHVKEISLKILIMNNINKLIIKKKYIYFIVAKK